ncbi:hypothetical protein E2P81_ATG04649 [Venturia nashicola]|nr:hypothetical protein E2P81_ATG04649 [Venturia nashicola]
MIAPPPPSLTPANDNLEACAATATFFLYAQRNLILVLHHDTLAIDRRFEKHKEDVLWIAVDNVSDRGGGRLVVSYDTTQTTIVWDLMTGHEVARFASYEEIRVAAWMKNSNIAFGNSQGNVILFEPSTSEHISARTIFDPITALAPSGDSRTFAIGYMNGSILVATLQPFTILHTLSSNRAPSPLSRLAWHGSSSKQKSDMLAAQTIDGDLRVWSIPKTPNGETPSVIRVLSRTENDRASGLNWFGWSKMGRIIQYSAGLTFVWDVRTKRVTYESVPTVDGLVSIANYGPSATLFTLGRNHTVQQYDLNPSARPMLVQNVQHVPAQLPPSPPISDGEGLKSARYATAGPASNLRPNPSDTDRPPSNNIPVYFEDIHSESESEVPMSPLARISKADPDEDRDQLGPLSPVSSRDSTTSKSSAGGGGGRRQKQKQQQQQQPQQQPQQYEQPRIGNLNDFRYQQQNERPNSPGMVSSSAQSVSTATTFSMGSSRQGYPQRARRESVSTRSLLSTSTSNSRASNGRSSRLRQEVLRSPEETKNLMSMDLFPYTKARLGDIPFRPPIYDQNRRTPDDLRVQMLNVVFGWPEDVEELIRDELARHPSGSASSVMLSKWLGDLDADIAASMIGSESMTSSDWMLLALSSMGQDSQKKVGEAFVQRLLEKGDIHPAVSILLGLGEYDEAVEVYVSRKYYMEAVLLTCLFFPTDWQRQSYLVRKWGEIAVGDGHPELAVRCFSCTTLESSEPWFSPRAQDAVYATQQMLMGPDTSLSSASPVSAGGSARIHPTQAGLKLVTNFSQPAARGPESAMDGSKTPMVYPGETPIEPAAMESAFRPSYRDPVSAMSARTATPGGYGRRRYPSSRRTEASDLSLTTPLAHMPTPMTAIKGMRDAPSTTQTQTTRTRRSASTSQASSFLTASEYQEDDRGRSGLPSPAQGVFARLREEESAKNHRGSSRERKPSQLSLDNIDIVIDSSLPSGATQSSYTNMTAGNNSMLGGAYETRRGATSPGPSRTGISMQSAKIRSIDQFINGLDEANYQAPDRTHEAPERPGSRSTRRAPSEGGRRTQVIRPAKRSPSSPVSMSPDDPALQLSNYNFDDERFYKRASPTESAPSISMHDREVRNQERSRGPGGRSESKSRRNESAIRIETKRERSRRRGGSTTGERPGKRAGSREPTVRRAESIRRESRSRNQARQPSYEEMANEREGRGRSAVRGPGSATRSPSSPSGNFPMSPAESNMGGGRSKIGERVRERSMSRARNRSPAGSPAGGRKTSPDPSANARKSSRPPIPRLQTNMSDQTIMNKRELAAKELEERRLSLARRPSAPPIVHPHELIPRSAGTPSAEMWMGGFYKHHIPSEHELIRGHTADPLIMRNLTSATSQGGVSNKPVQIGLPATPRAMRHPKYMGEGEVKQVPAVPEIPANFGRSNNDIQHEQYPQEEGNDTLGFLPTSTFQPSNAGPSRSASAPPEKLSALGHQRRISHTRQGSSHSRKNSDSGDIIVVSPGGMGNGGGLSFSKTIDQTIRESQIMFVDRSPSPDDEDVPPVMLPELQHLVGPIPPPPPPMPLPPRQDSVDAPTLSPVAFMPYEEEPQQQAKPTHSRSNSSNNQIPQLSAPEVTTPGGSVMTPGGHRRGRNSISENVGSKFSGLRNRLRDRTPSRTRNPAISSPIQQNQQPTPFEIVTQQQAQRQPASYESLPQQASPYESLPQATFGQSLPQSTFGKTPSPYESLPQQSQRRPSQGNAPQARMPYETQISASVNPAAGNSGGSTQVRMPYETQVSAAVNPAGGTVQEQTREQQQQSTLLPSTTFGGYRLPKEIARQMREEQLQQQREYGAEISRGGAATAPPRSTSMYGRRDKLSANLPPLQLQPGGGDRGNMI